MTRRTLNVLAKGTTSSESASTDASFPVSPMKVPSTSALVPVIHKTESTTGDHSEFSPSEATITDAQSPEVPSQPKPKIVFIKQESLTRQLGQMKDARPQDTAITGANLLVLPTQVPSSSALFPVIVKKDGTSDAYSEVPPSEATIANAHSPVVSPQPKPRIIFIKQESLTGQLALTKEARLEETTVTGANFLVSPTQVPSASAVFPVITKEDDTSDAHSVFLPSETTTTSAQSSDVLPKPKPKIVFIKQVDLSIVKKEPQPAVEMTVPDTRSPDLFEQVPFPDAHIPDVSRKDGTNDAHSEVLSSEITTADARSPTAPSGLKSEVTSVKHRTPVEPVSSHVTLYSILDMEIQYSGILLTGLSV